MASRTAKIRTTKSPTIEVVMVEEPKESIVDIDTEIRKQFYRGRNVQRIFFSKNNVTGFRGARYHKSKRLYEAEICTRGKKYWLGSYTTAEEAAKAYDKAARIIYGDGAITNFDENGNFLLEHLRNK